ncbi:hypothetical protein [Thiorhodovibrio winogradskyi]|uniref:hypothetical protein n=1 Tax=Thiorhodovibrio winogradskyi TaxID=77007 RepID=UPI002E29A97A|nr:hypothetical protein [Thiorhodovibrio winogradskyi]
MGTGFSRLPTVRRRPALLDRLNNWADKDWQQETAAGSTFIDLFFKQTWGYCASGEGEKGSGYTLIPEFAVKGAGSGGGTGMKPLYDLGKAENLTMTNGIDSVSTKISTNRKSLSFP